MCFGENVRWRRVALGLSQATLASQIRVNRKRTTASYISRLESGALDPRLSTVRSIARALHVKPWQLVAGLGESVTFWEGYLELTGEQKRDVQRHIDWLQRRGRQTT
jgi:transcriptional regulator with XRE-family HTH domain